MKWLPALAMLLVTFTADAAIETYQFDSGSQEARFRTLTLELRCPKCQNQAIGDSDAEISQDLRAEVYRMLKTGATNNEIKDFMVDRYGRYVLYNPPLDRQTLVLWFGPLIFLLIGAVGLAVRIRRSKQAMDHRNTSA
ncbi:cytochrome c-type biogenesis protein CcmH [Litorivicinus sp.]|jgi:cytochrome c-type biogenesis protein CcmH|nr:cytochrome c-type biogenesis protein CcmH [Litorivicinus sp.]|tara:strand:- start:20507 stop:20920 length:414 start_codon:yes stop_codon:yes gene_type:complete